MHKKLETISLGRKGQVDILSSHVLSLMVAAIILVLALVITQELRDSDVVGVNSTAYFAANKTVAGLGTFADFWVILVLASVASVVIGVILYSFAGERAR